MTIAFSAVIATQLLYSSCILASDHAIMATTPSARSLTSAILQPPSYLRAEVPSAFASRRSSRACAVPRPTRGVCSPRGGRVQGPSFTRRNYGRERRPRQSRSISSVVVNSSHNNYDGVRSEIDKIAMRSSSSSAVSTDISSTEPDAEELSSSRGRNAVSLLPVYLTDARAVTKFDPINAPDGALQLSVAENQMLEDLLVPALRKFATSSEQNDSGEVEGLFQSDQIYYQPTHGREGLREAMSGYLKRILKLSPDQSLDLDGMVLGAGCNAVLENLCFCLTEPGDAVLLPTPYYAAFEFDLVARAALNIVPVNTMEFNDTDFNALGKTIPQSCYYPNAAALDAAYDKAKAAGSEPKILLLSHPNNPLGICYPPSVVKECIDWAREKKVHLVSDEIYAGSVYRSTNPMNGEDIFQSALSLASDENNKTGNSENGLGLGPYVHFVYALSKDFALSGLRVGVAYSENEAIRMPMQKLNDLCQISSQTQQTVEQMLSAKCEDGLWSTDEFLPENNDRIRQRSDRVQLCLDECEIPSLFGDSGLFLWMDFTEFLPPLTDDSREESEESKDIRERSLYLELLKEFGLLFTPGRSMKNELPGFFRFVFTAASDEEFELGLKRIKNYVKVKRNN
jgi:1-aminocyclopropane-1-carboxylate synthase